MNWPMRHVQALLFALGRMARTPFASAFTILVIALALTLPAAFGLLVGSLRGATADLARTVTIGVYFKRDVPLERVRQLADSVRERAGVATVEVIPADEGLAAFREESGFGEALEALEGNPLPHVIDVRPTVEAATPAAMEDLRRHLAAWPEVDVVQADGAWVQRLQAILDLLRRLLIGTAVLLGVGVVAVLGNTVRLEILNRRAEIEITQLVGGNRAFVRRPFLYTGVLYGGIGGALGLALVLLMRFLLTPPVARLAASYGSDFTLLMPTPAQAAGMVGLGAFLGLLGAWISASRHLRDVAPKA